MTTRGFILLYFLMVFALLLAVVLLSLSVAPWLGRATSAIMAHSEQQNEERAMLRQLHRWLAQQQIPTACWHQSKDIDAAKAVFIAQPQLGCTLTVGHDVGFYWLELWPQVFAKNPQLHAYQLWLQSPAGFAAEEGVTIAKVNISF